jgi:hypothetical protein
MQQQHSLNPVMVGGQLVKDPALIMDAWADYFEQLARPQNIDNAEYQTEELNHIISLISQLSKHPLIVHHSEVIVTQKEVEKAIKALNSGKAVDDEGLAAEHLKAAGHSVIKPLQILLNTLLRAGQVPDQLKSGRKIPFPKKDKDPLVMGNHRGITITSLLGKLLEHIILSKISGRLPNHDLQYGFTENKAPAMAALCVTEAIAQVTAKDPLIIITLDVEKAFDTVDHKILLEKLYRTSIPLPLWAAVSSIYEAPREHVVLSSFDSRKYEVRQGVRQGGVLSTHLYKLYLHELLVQLQRHAEGLYLGPYFLGSPTCADDLLLMARSELDMQLMLDAVNAYAKAHKYRINPTKTTLTFYGKKQDGDLYLGDDIISPTKEFKHLGILRTNKGNNNSTLLEDRAKTGRRTVYALMPSGLHGQDGLSPATASSVIRAYVLPRMIHGLEAMILKNGDLMVLEKAYKQILRDIQSLSKRTASEAVYLLMGMLPIQAEIHIRTLSLFGAVMRLEEGTLLRNLAERQLAVNSNPRTCWFRYVWDIAKTYGLESSLIGSTLNPISKEGWKDLITSSVKNFWVMKLKRTAIEKSSLKHINLIYLSEGEPHPVWPEDAPPVGILAASYRAKMLSGTYILQSTRAKFNQHEVDPICLLCREEEEDMIHFIVRCPALKAIRSTKLKTEMLPVAEKLMITVPEEATEQCRFILNGGYPYHRQRDVSDTGRLSSHVDFSTLQKKLQKICSMLCYRLHMKRFELLSNQD